MKNVALLFLLMAGLLVYSCNDKETEEADPYNLLVGATWVADSLLANGMDASGPGGVLEKFKGEAKFNTDGTGTFGEYSGTWLMSPNKKEVTITTLELVFPILARIEELTNSSLKINTGVPSADNPEVVLAIRMTFKAK
jgi:hypothetical protein